MHKTIGRSFDRSCHDFFSPPSEFLRKEVETMKTVTITFDADASPLLTFAELFQRSLKTPIDIGDLPAELVRAESHPGPAGTHEIMVRFYPSDRFLDFASAVLAGDLDLRVVKKTSRKDLPS
jgi:hypothetical protein